MLLLQTRLHQSLLPLLRHPFLRLFFFSFRDNLQLDLLKNNTSFLKLTHPNKMTKNQAQRFLKRRNRLRAKFNKTHSNIYIQVYPLKNMKKVSGLKKDKSFLIYSISIFMSILIILFIFAFSSNIASAGGTEYGLCNVQEVLASGGDIKLKSIAKELGMDENGLINLIEDYNAESPPEEVLWWLIPIGIVLIFGGGCATQYNVCSNPPGGECSLGPPPQTTCVPLGNGHCIYTCVPGPGGVGHYEEDGVRGDGLCP